MRVRILERQSGLIFNKDFYCGYSPERINPGDKEHRVTTIKKVTAGSTPEIATEVDELYKEIITAGTCWADQHRHLAAAYRQIDRSQRWLTRALITEIQVFDLDSIRQHGGLVNGRGGI